MTEEKTDKIVELLEEILKWVRLEGAPKAKDALIGLLKTDVEKLVYESSDGRTSREIAQIVGTSHATVTNYWKKWARYGIVKETSTRGGGTRFLKAFSMADFGLEVPRIATRDRPTERETEQDLTREKQPSERTATENGGV